MLRRSKRREKKNGGEAKRRNRKTKEKTRVINLNKQDAHERYQTTLIHKPDKKGEKAGSDHSHSKTNPKKHKQAGIVLAKLPKILLLAGNALIELQPKFSHP